MSNEPPPVRVVSDRSAFWEWESIPREVPRPRCPNEACGFCGQLARRLSPHPPPPRINNSRKFPLAIEAGECLLLVF
jgi:hypothetical protein